MIIGLITTQTNRLGVTDYMLQDWAAAGLRVTSIFRCFIVTIPPSTNPILIGHLSERDWQGVCACVRTSFAGLD